MLNETEFIIEKNGMVYIKSLTKYLKKIKISEQLKDENNQRYVPSLTELAESIGVSIGSLSHLRRAKSLKLSHASAILTEMRRRGFPMQITDLIGFEPPVFEEPETEPEKPTAGIKELTLEYLKANEEEKERMRQTMPNIIKAIERHLERKVEEALEGEKQKEEPM